MGLRKIIACFSFFLFCINASAQQNLTNLVGVIADKASKAPIEFANVELLKAIDSMVVTGVVTDAKGKFSIGQVKLQLLTLSLLLRKSLAVQCTVHTCSAALAARYVTCS